MKNTENNPITLRSLFVVTALVSAMIVSGCNTVEGVGQDTEAAGEAIQRSAR